MPTPDLEQRVSLALALRRYLKASERFHDASQEFEAACQEIRTTAPRPTRSVIRVDCRHWIFEMNDDGDFQVETIDML